MGTSPSDAPLAQRVLREQVASLYRIYDTIFRSRMVFVVVIGAIMYEELRSPAVIVYTAMHFLLSLATLLAPRWTRDAPVAESAQWVRKIAFWTGLAGIADGVAPWFFVISGDLSLTAILMVVMMANCTRAVQSLRPFKLALVGYVVAAMGSLIVALIWHGGAYYYFLAAFSAMHLAMLLRAGMQENDQLTEALVLRFRNEELAAELRRQVLATERASREKTRFLTTASHDLRQPLHAVSLFGAALENRLRDREESTHARRLMQAVDALGHSLETMLDVSRIDAGVVKPAFRSMPLDAVLLSLDHVFGVLAEQRGLQLRIRACGCWVRSDPQLLSRILSNLIDNALKYTPQGGVVVAPRIRGDRVWVDIRDTGIGIAPDQLERVFDEFYQVGNPGRDRSQGLGIGLSIVRRLSRVLDHPVDVRSRAGRGTLFRVCLPLDMLPASDGSGAAPGWREQELAPTCPMPRRVLLLDDEADIRDAMAALFETWNVPLTAVGTEAQAVAAMEEAGRTGERFDLLIADYRLSGAANGAEVGLRLRARFDPELPLLLITGETEPERLQEIHALGIAMVGKPIDAMTLRRMLFAMARGEAAH